MRQNEAHSALRVFLFRAVAKGHRMVLVITGKGSPRRIDGRFGEFVNEGALGTGVLRRNVPIWLEEPEIRSIVVGYTTAHIKHGGEGALYVQLRRRK
jgi:DNA-nicking Smr family endonuclease